MNKNMIYITQFGTGTNINLLPLAAGQLASRLKIEKWLSSTGTSVEILTKRQNPETLVQSLEDVSVIGFSCFLWNLEISLRNAKEVRRVYPNALIVLGGPAIPKATELLGNFFETHSYVDIICKDEGEDVFTSLCKNFIAEKQIVEIPGLIINDRISGKIVNTGKPQLPDLNELPSPFLDGTFDIMYQTNKDEFSGIAWETNRGCPYECTYCTWGNLPSKKIREKPLELIKNELTWIGKNEINYIAMTDSNFGIRKRDIAIAQMLADCKNQYGFPNFVSVSWAKNSPENVLEVARILKNNGIGFRITQALQSLDKKVVDAVKRKNIDPKVFQHIKEAYYKENYYTYTELILGLPLETYDSYINGIEELLSDSIFEQLYVYPLFLFPNTEIGTLANRKKYGLLTNTVPLAYTKSKNNLNKEAFNESVEMVIGTKSMPLNNWANSFVEGYFTIGIHDDRLAFFILWYLKNEYSIKITDLISFVRKNVQNSSIIKNGFSLLEKTAHNVQQNSNSHLIALKEFDSIPYDPPEGIFLYLLLNKEQFFEELFNVTKEYLIENRISFYKEILQDLFVFQNAVMAHPKQTEIKSKLFLKYNWFDYFAYSFHKGKCTLQKKKAEYIVVDKNPSDGNCEQFLKNHFDIRGVPAFNTIYNKSQQLIFPLF